jgi:hypothetical protein
VPATQTVHKKAKIRYAAQFNCNPVVADGYPSIYYQTVGDILVTWFTATPS